MTETGWLASASPQRLIRHLIPDRQTERKLMLLAVAGCRVFDELLIAPQTRKALDLIESAAELAPDRRRYRLIERQAARGLGWATRAGQRYYSASVAVRALAAGGVRINLEVVLSHLRSAALDEGIEETTVPRLCNLVRDIFGNPFRRVTFDLAWRTQTAMAIAQGIYESRDFSALPILADALQDAGCDSDDVLSHCREGSGIHVRGCWVVDLVLGKK